MRRESKYEKNLLSIFGNAQKYCFSNAVICKYSEYYSDGSLKDCENKDLLIYPTDNHFIVFDYSENTIEVFEAPFVWGRKPLFRTSAGNSFIARIYKDGSIGRGQYNEGMPLELIDEFHILEIEKIVGQINFGQILKSEVEKRLQTRKMTQEKNDTIVRISAELAEKVRLKYWQYADIIWDQIKYDNGFDTLWPNQQKNLLSKRNFLLEMSSELKKYLIDLINESASEEDKCFFNSTSDLASYVAKSLRGQKLFYDN